MSKTPAEQRTDNAIAQAKEDATTVAKAREKFQHRRDAAMYAWALIVTIVLAVALVKSYSADRNTARETHAVAVDVRNQKANRVANVVTWCGAIDADRDYQRARVTANIKKNLSLHIAPYTLKDLNCKQLEIKTARSGGK